VLDVLLHGGTVVDGSGAPRGAADVGIRGARIAFVGPPNGAEAERVLDVTGHVVAPGVIDIHTHSDFTLLEERQGRSALRQGVTTEVVGNCGQSYAPITERNREGITQRSLGWQPSVEVDWSSVGEYLDRVREGNGANCYFLVGHAAVRSAVMGFDERPASGEEIDAMVRVVEEALDDGARGLSFGLEYPPARKATADELAALAGAVRRAHAFLGCHMKNRDAWFEESTDEIIEASRRGDSMLQLSHLLAKPGHKPGAWERVLKRIEASRARGHDVAADTIPYDTGPGFATAFLPDWAVEGGPGATLRRLKDPELRARMRQDYDRYWRFVAAGEWDRLALAYSSAHPDWVGESFDVLAEHLRMDPIDVLLQLFEDEGIGLGRVTVNGRLFSEEHVRECLRQPFFALGSDGWRGTRDGGPGEVAHHPNCWGFVPKVLGEYVRETGQLTLEEAIRKMTSFPAERLGITDRGLVREGYHADLVVFDLERVGTDSDYRRPAVMPRGIAHVFVNGRQVLADGELTGVLAGAVL
jgi:N-acyl-D-amino-acid deacylase